MPAALKSALPIRKLKVLLPRYREEEFAVTVIFAVPALVLSAQLVV